jgi:hypothetical protein
MTKLHVLGLLVVATMIGTFASCDLYEGPNDVFPPPGCAAGCLCFGSDENACVSNGCPWNGSYCVNFYSPDAGASDGGPGDAVSTPDATTPIASCGGAVTCTIQRPGCRLPRAQRLRRDLHRHRLHDVQRQCLYGR